MFPQEVNTMRRRAFSAPQNRRDMAPIDEPHDSMARLFEWATDKGALDGQGVREWADLRRVLDVSDGRLTNWKRRGISKEGALLAHRLFGCDPNWLLTGEGPTQTDGDAPPIGVPRRVGLPVLSLPDPLEMRHPPLLSWEDLMTTDHLQARFRVALTDDALAPGLRSGDELEFDRRLADAAEPGDLVLVRDREGHHYARFLRRRTSAQWSAAAANPAYEDLDVARDGLSVVAVCTVEIKRRRRSLSS